MKKLTHSILLLFFLNSSKSNVQICKRWYSYQQYFKKSNTH